MEFLNGVPPEVISAFVVAVLIIVFFLVAVLFRALTRTEVYRQAQIKYGLLVEFVTDAIFQAEFAKPEVLAAYEEKSAATGYNKKLLLVADLVEQRLAAYGGITVDFETQIFPIVERLLRSDATPASMTPADARDVSVVQAETQAVSATPAELRHRHSSSSGLKTHASAHSTKTS